MWADKEDKPDVKPDTKQDNKTDTKQQNVEPQTHPVFIPKNKAEVKPIMFVDTDVKKRLLSQPEEKPKVGVAGGNKSSHVFSRPTNTFTMKAQAAEVKIINLKLCDPNGNIWDFKVSNKKPIFKSVITPFVQKANLDARVSLRLLEKRSSWIWNALFSRNCAS